MRKVSLHNTNDFIVDHRRTLHGLSLLHELLDCIRKLLIPIHSTQTKSINKTFHRTKSTINTALCFEFGECVVFLIIFI